jgi:hypothetical protein
MLLDFCQLRGMQKFEDLAMKYVVKFERSLRRGVGIFAA